MNKLKAILATMLLMTISHFSNAASVQDVMKKFEGAGIYEVDWDKEDGVYSAESNNEVRYIKVKIGNEKALARIDLANQNDFQILAVMNCYYLTSLVPMDRAKTWSDDPTEDELLLQSVLDKDIKTGQTRENNIKGWNVSFTRTQEGAHCSVKKL
ncbi:hypothetical protein DDN27_003444 [Vibrio cholerae]